MIGVKLEPVDTWFFRDGTPFSAGSAPQEGVGSIFPPSPATTVGALRAAIARCNGWDGRGRWSKRKQISAVLGDGSKDIGKLKVDGPFLLWNGNPLFQVPRHVLGTNETGGWIPKALLGPGAGTECDLGDDIRLPFVSSTPNDIGKLKNGDGHWLTLAGLASVLAGEVPAASEIVPSKRLWSEELRIGLERDGSTRTAMEGMLYSTRHVRLGQDVALGMRVSGIPGEWTMPFGRMVPLGGESRLAFIEEWIGDIAFDWPAETIKGSGQVAIVALSPLDLKRNLNCGQTRLDVLGGAEVVSACLDRPQRIGGWDSLAHSSLPLRSVLPPGSVLFCEKAERGPDAVGAGSGMIHLGDRQQWGFGLAAVGAWPNELGET